jgi:regulator of RNase E activity RraA
MVETPDIQRPDPAFVSKLAEIGTATISSELAKLGIRSAHLLGPVARTPGIHVAGPALTLQCMPKREDVFVFDEYGDPEEQLHRNVMYHTQPGDVIVVDARGDMSSGIFGEMMMTYFKAQGGVGVVVDGCIRDFGQAKDLGVGLWLRGTTPNFHAQTNIFPYAVNVPVACGGTLVLPGDIIVADDDGAVVVPVSLAEKLIAAVTEHVGWEVFSRQRLAEGGDMRTYYPLSEEGRKEYEDWRRDRASLAGDEDAR